MSDHVTAAEIADLTHRIRCLHQHRPVDPVDQAVVLAMKAELLARIADQRAEELGPCDYTTEAREIADQAKAIAANAARIVRLRRPAGGAKSEENSPPPPSVTAGPNVHLDIQIHIPAGGRGRSNRPDIRQHG